MPQNAMADDRGGSRSWQSSLLASFYVNYFGSSQPAGGRSHLTYVTAPTEPKQQAFEHILASGRVAQARGRSSAAVVAVWPLTYLATMHPQRLGQRWSSRRERSTRL